MDVDEEMPTLPPEIKINMKLDDIIKYEKMKAGVSHNLQFKEGQYIRSRKFRPYFKRRYKSQNWRLRGNGPNTGRFRHYSNFQRVGKVRAFLERKWKSAPINSVFHRLGWNPLQETARAKVWNARNYYRPQRPRFPFQKKINQNATYDPNRAKKLIQSARIYTARLGDGLGGLSESNFEKLNEALGGGVTTVKEVEAEPGIIKTLIVQRLPDEPCNSFSPSRMNPVWETGYPHTGYHNGYNPNAFGYNGNAFGYNGNAFGYNANAFGFNANAFGYNANALHNPQLNSMYQNMSSLSSNPKFINGMGPIGLTRSVNLSNGTVISNGLRGANVNSLSNTVNQNNWSRQQVIDALNRQTDAKPTSTAFGNGIIDDRVATVPVHSTGASIHGRFASTPLTIQEDD